MVSFEEFSGYVSRYGPIFRTLFLVVGGIVLIGVVVGIIRGALLKRARTKNQRHNIQIFSNILLYTLVILLFVMAFFSYAESWTGAGLTLGLVSAALGWALQRPITGIAAWIMVVIRRPFKIGDRIIVSGVAGDVVNITLTHIYLGEIGAAAVTEERSGRIVMIPNSLLFEQNIINYTHQGEYVLDEIVFTITHESDLKETIGMTLEAVEVVLDKLNFKKQDSPYVRTYFSPNGVNIHVRYFALATRRAESASLITQEIFERIRKAKKVNFAYAHQDIRFKTSLPKDIEKQ